MGNFQLYNEQSELRFGGQAQWNPATRASGFVFAIGALLAAAGVVAVLLGRSSAAIGIAVALVAVLALMGDSARAIVLGLMLLLVVPPTRMQQSILESDVSSLPNDAVVRASFSLIPDTTSYLPEAILASMLVMVVLRGGWKSLEAFRRQRLLSSAVLLFVAICTLNVMVALESDPNILVWLRDYIPVITLLAMFPLAAILSGSLKNFRFAFMALMGFCVVLLLHSMYAAAVTGLTTRLSEITPYNTLPFVGICIVSLVPFLIFRRTKSMLRLLPVLGMALIVLMLTQTRALVGACIAAIGVILVLALHATYARRLPDVRRRAVLICITLTVLSAAAFAFFGTGMMDRFSTMQEDESVAWRPIEINVAYNKFLRSPIVGHGLGSEFALPGVEPWRYIHNSIFYYLADTGIVGTAVWLLIWLAALYICWSDMRFVPDELLPYFVSYSAILVVLFIYSLFQTSYRTFQNSILLALALAGLQACTTVKIHNRAGHDVETSAA